ncbi:MAG: hypothetical protein WDO73_30945 [Ignavibacteriota bacterium]
MLAVVWLVAVIVVHGNSRLVLTGGLTVTAIACWVCAHLDPSWAGTSFESMDLLMAVGFAGSYVGLVGSLVLEGLESGALMSAANAATYSGFVHLVRLFGGQVGVTAMTHFISTRQKLHSNLLGLHVQTGAWLSDDRLRMLTGSVLSRSNGTEEAQYRAAGILGQQVRAQAFTMATADGFILIGWMVVAYLLLALFLRPGENQLCGV